MFMCDISPMLCGQKTQDHKKFHFIMCRETNKGRFMGTLGSPPPPRRTRPTFISFKCSTHVKIQFGLTDKIDSSALLYARIVVAKQPARRVSTIHKITCNKFYCPVEWPLQPRAGAIKSGGNRSVFVEAQPKKNPYNLSNRRNENPLNYIFGIAGAQSGPPPTKAGPNPVYFSTLFSSNVFWWFCERAKFCASPFILFNKNISFLPFKQLFLSCWLLMMWYILRRCGFTCGAKINEIFFSLTELCCDVTIVVPKFLLQLATAFHAIFI